MLDRRLGVAAAATLIVGLGLTGCGGSHARGQATAGAPTSPASPTGQTSADPAHGGQQTGGHATGTPKGSYDDTTGTLSHPPKNQNAVLTHLPGPKSPGCVKVGTRTDVRSGPMAMGNFADARTKFAQAKTAYNAAPSFFYVIPTSRSVKSVTVTATRLGGGGTPVHVHSSDVERAAQWSYFPIQITLPSAGTWRFQVSTTGEHGCFDAAFRT